MPVLNAEGIVGQIIITDKKYSQVLPYSHTMFRVSAEIEGSRAYGIVTWQGSSMRELVMHFVPETVEDEIGETVVTYRFSNRFPFGIINGALTRIVICQWWGFVTFYL